MSLAKCYLCDKPFVFRGNGVYETTCEHEQGNRCAKCGESEVHHVANVKACFGKNGTTFCPVTKQQEGGR